MLTTYDILQEEGKRGVVIFQKAIEPHYATGKTKKSAFYRIEGREKVVSLTILARAFVPVLETGSKPAKTNVPSKEMIEELTPWAKARGIPEEAIYPIAKELLRKGQQVNRNVYSQQMEEFGDEVVDRVVNEFAGLAINQVVNAFEK